jgi:hypothetical protein
MFVQSYKRVLVQIYIQSVCRHQNTFSVFLPFSVVIVKLNLETLPVSPYR